MREARKARFKTLRAPQLLSLLWGGLMASPMSIRWSNEMGRAEAGAFGGLGLGTEMYHMEMKKKEA